MSINPYAAPLSDVELVERDQCWREAGGSLYIKAGSDLPQRCIKCNRPAVAPVKKRTLYWHASGWYVLILLNLLLYALVALFIRRKIKVSPGLCAGHDSRRKRIMAASVAVFVACLAVGALTIGQDGLVSLASFALALVAMVAAHFGTRLVYPVEINERGARLKGFGDEFLRSLGPKRREPYLGPG